MKIRTNCECSTSLQNFNSLVENYDDYIDYINEVIYKRIGSTDTVGVIQTNDLGELKVRVGIDELLSSYGTGDKATIEARMETERDDLNEDQLMDIFEKDRPLMQHLYDLFLEHVDVVNDAIKDIMLPVDENLIFKYEHFYMEISTFNPTHTPSFIPLKLNKDFNFDEDIIENIYI